MLVAVFLQAESGPVFSNGGLAHYTVFQITDLLFTVSFAIICPILALWRVSAWRVEFKGNERSSHIFENVLGWKLLIELLFSQLQRTQAYKAPRAHEIYDYQDMRHGYQDIGEVCRSSRYGRTSVMLSSQTL